MKDFNIIKRTLTVPTKQLYHKSMSFISMLRMALFRYNHCFYSLIIYIFKPPLLRYSFLVFNLETSTDLKMYNSV